MTSKNSQARLSPAARLDVTDPISVEALIERTLAAYGRLDGSFNGAGQSHQPAPLAELAVGDFDEHRRQCPGVFLAMKSEIPAMLETGGGAIVNMSSTAGLHGVRGIAGYGAAKHAVVGLTTSGAVDYALLAGGA